MLCVDCGKLMRPGKTLAKDYPGTVQHNANGRCAWCAQQHRAAKAMAPDITADEWPRLPGSVRAYLTERRRRLAAA
jgi:hypothetical protein